MAAPPPVTEAGPPRRLAQVVGRSLFFVRTLSSDAGDLRNERKKLMTAVFSSVDEVAAVYAIRALRGSEWSVVAMRVGGSRRGSRRAFELRNVSRPARTLSS